MTDLKRMSRQLLSEQGLSLPFPLEGGLFRIKAFGRVPGIFALVVKVGATCSEIVPGSFDALQAGPDDVVLPPFVLGEDVLLALGHHVTVPNTALGTGFAKLAREAYEHVLADLTEFTGGGRNFFLASGFPYVSRHDARLAFHRRLANGVERAQDGLQEALAQAESLRRALARRKPVWGVSQERMVAGEQGEADVRRTLCRVAGTKIQVHLFHDAGAGVLELSVYDAKGYETRELDGWRLLARDGRILGTVEGDRLHLDGLADFDGVCVLLDVGGGVHALSS